MEDRVERVRVVQGQRRVQHVVRRHAQHLPDEPTPPVGLGVGAADALGRTGRPRRVEIVSESPGLTSAAGTGFAGSGNLPVATPPQPSDSPSSCQRRSSTRCRGQRSEVGHHVSLRREHPRRGVLEDVRELLPSESGVQRHQKAPIQAQPAHAANSSNRLWARTASRSPRTRPAAPNAPPIPAARSRTAR